MGQREGAIVSAAVGMALGAFEGAVKIDFLVQGNALFKSTEPTVLMAFLGISAFIHLMYFALSAWGMFAAVKKNRNSIDLYARLLIYHWTAAFFIEMLVMIANGDPAGSLLAPILRLVTWIYEPAQAISAYHLRLEMPKKAPGRG